MKYNSQTREVEVFCGDYFSDAALYAKGIALGCGNEVWFTFNGITVSINTGTNLENLERDLHNAFLMGWKVIGPICDDEYSDTMKKAIARKKMEREEEQRIAEGERAAKLDADRAAITAKIGGRRIELKSADEWTRQVEINQDAYGAAVIRYAKTWAILMQIEIEKGVSVSDCADRTSHEADYEGITGFMYGCAVNILSHVWTHGEALRIWYNAQHH